MRYLPHTPQTETDMLNTIGVKSIDNLYAHVPQEALNAQLDLPPHQGELEVERAISAFAAQNRTAESGPFFLGAGSYRHHVPATVDYMIQRSEFLTSYTPYQPEVSQGTLTYLFEFQSYIAAITGMDVANASMYEGATALAEAALMAMRVTRRTNVVVANPLHPHYRETLETYLGLQNATFQQTPDNTTACVIVQLPDFEGNITALEHYRSQCDACGALLVVVTTEIIAFGVLPAPEQADIVCGEARSLGNGLNFGGPYLGIFACREKYLRQMPGRLCGETLDADGNRAFVLTLNTREQHIRRDKATSNICTNQGLCALAFTVHLSLLGEEGFKKLALLNHAKACQLADALSAINGITLENETFFNEFTVSLPCTAQQVCDTLLAQHGIMAGYPVGENRLLVAATEMTTDADIETFSKALATTLASL